MPCILPWIDPSSKKKHEGCAEYENEYTRFWCPTKVDDNMKYVSGNWGFCNENCLIDGNFTSNFMHFNFSCFFSPTGKSYTKQLD